MLRPTREDLLFAPGGDGAESLAGNERLERRFVRPLAGDEVRRVVGDVFPQRGTRVPRRRVQGVDHRGELLLEVLLLAGKGVVVHADGDHFEALRSWLR